MISTRVTSRQRSTPNGEPARLPSGSVNRFGPERTSTRRTETPFQGEHIISTRSSLQSDQDRNQATPSG